MGYLKCDGEHGLMVSLFEEDGGWMISCNTETVGTPKGVFWWLDKGVTTWMGVLFCQGWSWKAW